MSNSVYYVGIEDADALRKDILESAKHSVAVLKSKKDINSLRAQRHEKVEQLRETMMSMNAKLKSLKKVLPKHTKSKLPKSIKQVEKRIQHKREEQEEQKPKPSRSMAEDMTLTELTGVGSARELKLRSAGYDSVTKLAQANLATLTKKTSMSTKVAKKLITNAQKALGSASKEESSKKKHTDDSPKKSAIEAEDDRLDTEINALESKLSEIERKLNNL